MLTVVTVIAVFLALMWFFTADTYLSERGRGVSLRYDCAGTGISVPHDCFCRDLFKVGERDFLPDMRLCLHAGCQ